MSSISFLIRSTLTTRRPATINFTNIETTFLLSHSSTNASASNVCNISKRSYNTKKLVSVQAKKYLQQRRSSDDVQNNEASPIKQVDKSKIVYKGDFGGVTLRLQRVSLTTCFVGVVFLPASVYLKHGSLAVLFSTKSAVVGGTAMLAAVASTALLNYCVTPYVHQFEVIESSSSQNNNFDQTKIMCKATTRNMLAQEVVTVFDPVLHVTVKTSTVRPFCNFMAKGIPMYIHRETFEDKTVLRLLMNSR